MSAKSAIGRFIRVMAPTNLQWGEKTESLFREAVQEAIASASSPEPKPATPEEVEEVAKWHERQADVYERGHEPQLAKIHRDFASTLRRYLPMGKGERDRIQFCASKIAECVKCGTCVDLAKQILVALNGPHPLASDDGPDSISVGGLVIEKRPLASGAQGTSLSAAEAQTPDAGDGQLWYCCKVCGELPVTDGCVDHGKGCTEVDENGGGIEGVDPTECYMKCPKCGDPLTPGHVCTKNIETTVSGIAQPVPKETQVCNCTEHAITSYLHLPTRAVVPSMPSGVAVLEQMNYVALVDPTGCPVHGKPPAPTSRREEDWTVATAQEGDEFEFRFANEQWDRCVVGIDTVLQPSCKAWYDKRKGVWPVDRIRNIRLAQPQGDELAKLREELAAVKAERDDLQTKLVDLKDSAKELGKDTEKLLNALAGHPAFANVQPTFNMLIDRLRTATQPTPKRGREEIEREKRFLESDIAGLPIDSALRPGMTKHLNEINAELAALAGEEKKGGA